VTSNAKAELLAVYLERRPALVRFFATRTGCPDRAEDIVQDIYVRLQALSETSAREIANPAAFLYRIGGNLMLDGVRRRQRASARDQAWSDASSLSSDGVSVADSPSPEDAAWARLKFDRVAAAVEELAPNVRIALRLHRIEGLTHAEVAARMGVSRSSVEKYLSTALAHLLKRVGWP